MKYLLKHTVEIFPVFFKNKCVSSCPIIKTFKCGSGLLPSLKETVCLGLEYCSMLIWCPQHHLHSASQTHLFFCMNTVHKPVFLFQ